MRKWRSKDIQTAVGFSAVLILIMYLVIPVIMMQFQINDIILLTLYLAVSMFFSISFAYRMRLRHKRLHIYSLVILAVMIVCLFCILKFGAFISLTIGSETMQFTFLYLLVHGIGLLAGIGIGWLTWRKFRCIKQMD